ncbi:MAG: cysteine desulfurase family protein [Bryobacteraceae bacterium]
MLPAVAQFVGEALSEVPGNASSIHGVGQRARQELEKARRFLASASGVAPGEVVITGGGTESNNLAVFGVARRFRNQPVHVVTTTIEHPAVLEACRLLENEGAEVTRVDVRSSGVVDAESVRRAIRDNTVLVTVMHANNEVGTIQPVEEIAAAVRARRQSGQEIYLHSDGVQALGKIPVDIRELGVDLYSVSAHKVHAPKGTGALFVRKGVPLASTLVGGRHEGGRRAGTENVVGAMAFAKSLELLDNSAPVRLAALRDDFERQVLSSGLDAQINGRNAPRLPNTSNICFPRVFAENLVIALDLKGIAVSTGSACSSGSLEPSHVLLAMGLTREEARSSVRISFGAYQSSEDVRQLAEVMLPLVARFQAAKGVETRVAV